MLAGKLLIVLVRADAVPLAAAVFSLLLTVLLGREDHLHAALDPLLLQQLPYRARHAALMRLGDVGDPDLGRVEFRGRPHAGDDRNIPLTAGADQVQFAGDMVDGVDHVVVTVAQQKVAVLGGIEVLVRDDLSLRVDQAHPLRHDHGLGLADGAVHGVELPVDVGEADLVEIDDDQPPDAGPH